jgi:hypothetical protein
MSDTPAEVSTRAPHRKSQVPRTSTVRPNRDAAFRHEIASQAVVSGDQDIKVLAVSACASGTGKGHIAVRVGRLLVYVEDREALGAFRDAWNRATELADSAFGPLWITRRSEAAARIRRDGGTPLA